ncbi:hypothetical protein RMATCC62417_08346 [Rhizopus microsporus]|nr:hypothetical protein RMATCC62417_08346 [Rhizopus microsporus]
MKLFLFLLLIVKISCLTHLYEKSSTLVDYCDNFSSDVLAIEYFRISPDPLVRGEKLIVDFKGSLSEQVMNGTAIDVKVKYGILQIFKQTFNFCEWAEVVNEHCPFPEGQLEIHKQLDIPKEIRKLILLPFFLFFL